MRFLNTGGFNGTENGTVPEGSPSNVDIYIDNMNLKLSLNQIELNKSNAILVENAIHRTTKKETSKSTAFSLISMELLGIYGVKLVCRVVKVENNIDDASINIIKTAIINKLEKSTIGCFDYNAERGMINRIQGTMNIGDTPGGTVKINVSNISYDMGNARYGEKYDYSIAGSINISDNLLSCRSSRSDTCYMTADGAVGKKNISLDTAKLFSKKITWDSTQDNSNGFSFYLARRNGR